MRPSATACLMSRSEKIIAPSGWVRVGGGGAAPFLERVRRIELPFSAWEADVLPLNYTRRLI